MIRKVTAYIIRGSVAGHQLLVFEHDCGDLRFPLQVPAGTVDDGEEPGYAVLREITEESGLVDVELLRFLGSRSTDRPDLDVVELRFFYLFAAPQGCPNSWTHRVCGNGKDVGFDFPYSWINGDGFSRIVPLLAQLLTPETTPELYQTLEMSL